MLYNITQCKFLKYAVLFFENIVHFDHTLLSSFQSFLIIKLSHFIMVLVNMATNGSWGTHICVLKNWIFYYKKCFPLFPLDCFSGALLVGFYYIICI